MDSRYFLYQNRQSGETNERSPQKAHEVREVRTEVRTFKILFLNGLHQIADFADFVSPHLYRGKHKTKKSKLCFSHTGRGNEVSEVSEVRTCRPKSGGLGMSEKIAKPIDPDLASGPDRTVRYGVRRTGYADPEVTPLDEADLYALAFFDSWDQARRSAIARARGALRAPKSTFGGQGRVDGRDLAPEGQQ